MGRQHIDDVTLSRTVAHALRHKPWLYELELDDEGWVPVEALLAALRQRRNAWADLTEKHLAGMIARADKQRYELREGKIRALYGHSLKHRLAKTPAEPPEFLYHGTPTRAVEAILAQGLKPMGRQYVHLSVDVETAQEVGARRDQRPVVLVIRAGEAHRSGVPFYRGNEMVWLADHVPPVFIDEPSHEGKMDA
jgi:putative RNA 2'-phosphotransferase